MTDAEIEALTMHLSDPDNRPVVQPELALRLIARLDAERARAKKAEQDLRAAIREVGDAGRREGSAIARAEAAEAKLAKAREALCDPTVRRARHMRPITLGQAAKLTRTSKTTVTRAIKSGRLFAERRFDGSYRIDPAELSRVFEIDIDDTGGGET